MLEYRSTRFRLTAWACFMLSATLAVMGVSGWFAMRVSLYRAIDEDLENRLLDVEKFLQSQSDLSHEGVRKELGIRSSLGMGTSFYMVFDDLGNELYRSPQVGEYNLDVPPENPSDRIRFLKEGSYVANQNSLIHSLRTASKRINVRGTGIVIEVVEPLERRRSGTALLRKVSADWRAHPAGTRNTRRILDHTPGAGSGGPDYDGRALHHCKQSVGPPCGSESRRRIAAIVGNTESDARPH